MLLDDPIIRFYMEDASLIEPGFSLHRFITADNEWLEGCHNHIQWTFPLREPSAYNPNAPLLTNVTEASFKRFYTLRANLMKAHERFYHFLLSTQDTWKHEGNHNHLRITRVIKSCKLLSCPIQADMTYELAMRVAYAHNSGISYETIQFWNEAQFGEL